jgi:hypothetical protein
LPKDEFVKCPNCGENVRAGKRPELFVPDGFPPPPNHRSDPFCDCTDCMAMVSRKIAADALNRYANRLTNILQKDKRNKIIEIPKVSEYTHLKINEDWTIGIFNRTDGLDQSVVFSPLSIPYLILALQSAVQLTENKRGEFEDNSIPQATSEQENVVIEIPKISEETWIEIRKGSLCIHDRQGVEDFVCFHVKDVPYLIEAFHSVLALWKSAEMMPFNKEEYRGILRSYLAESNYDEFLNPKYVEKSSKNPN